MGEKRRSVQRFLAAGNTKCPICWTPFTSNAAITVEHVPPKSLGGVKACLTCRDCNTKFSNDEEFWRREITGTTRLSLEDKGGHRIGLVNANVAALDKPIKHISIQPSGGAWPSEDALSPIERTSSIKFQVPSEGQITRASVKSLYLMAGCARQGEAWTTGWAPSVRDYLQGNRPWDSGIGCYVGDNWELPLENFVMRCQVAGRSDVFVSAWKEHLCIFGASKADVNGTSCSIIWLENGPFIFGKNTQAK